jgi:chromosomal replication initiator protein
MILLTIPQPKYESVIVIDPRLDDKVTINSNGIYFIYKEINEIVRKVCSYLKVRVESLNLPTRKREIVEARQISMYFSKQKTKDSLQKIGNEIGGKDHATVLHACKTVNNLMETDKKFRDKIDELEKII